MSLFRVRVNLTGFSGAPGLSTYYAIATGVADQAQSAENWANRVAQFWASLVGPDSINTMFTDRFTASIEQVVDVIEETTGNLLAQHAVTTTPTSATGQTAGGQAPNATNLLLKLNTDGIVNNRPVRGRIFIGPTKEEADLDGTPTTTLTSKLNSAAAAELIATPDPALNQPFFAVWSRPFDGSPTVPARQGSEHQVTFTTVPDFWAIQRSRRD